MKCTYSEISKDKKAINNKNLSTIDRIHASLNIQF